MPSTVRFLRQLLLPRPSAVVREETTYRRAGEEMPASLYRPADRPPGSTSGLPGWVALHGLTYRGREHESLGTLARALAASGSAVLIPDIPEWRALRVAPETTTRTLEAAVRAFDELGLTAADRVGVIGFSFGGTHALVASTAPGLAQRVAGVASWGGYAGLDRTLRFAFLGEHTLDGDRHRLEPDPYGRWIFAGNYLTDLADHRRDAAVANALLWLAREVGRRKLLAWQSTTDPLKEEARAGLTRAQRALFDLIAPPAGEPPSVSGRARLGELADALVDAALERHPVLDPTPYLPRVRVPVFLSHGRDDRLIPWTELPRLHRSLPEGRTRHALVTRLFAHSFRERRFPTPTMAVEAVRFVRAINRMLRLI